MLQHNSPRQGERTGCKPTRWDRALAGRTKRESGRARPCPYPGLLRRYEDCYSKGNVSLCLFVAKFLNPSAFEVELKIKNIGSNVINFSYGASNVAVVDNLETRYSLSTIGQQGLQGSLMLNPGETSSLYNAGIWSWYFTGDFANPSVTNLTIIVTDVSTIDRAEWVFPVFH